eukprot:3737656-Prymnesium_polylepis.1
MGDTSANDRAYYQSKGSASITVHMGDTSAHDRAYYQSKGSASMSAYMHGLHLKSNVARVI